MRLSVRIPLLFGLVILITSASIGLTTLYISFTTLERNILKAVGAENESNGRILSAVLNGQLDVLGEIANRPLTRTMDWEIVQRSLMLDVSRIGALDLALLSTDGIARYVMDNTTADLHDRAYVTRAMAGEKNIGVVFSRVTNMTVVMLAAPIFASDAPNAPVAGVLIARKDGARTLSDLTASLRTTMSSGYNFLVDSTGTFIAHPDTGLVMNQFNPVNAVKDDPSLKPLADLVTTALRYKAGSSKYTYNGKNMLGQYSEVPGYSWILFSMIEQDDLYDQIQHMRYLVLIIIAGLLVIGLITAFFVGRSISKPVDNVANSLKHIAEGGGDLTKHLEVKSNDEFGALSLYFNQTLDQVAALITKIKYKVNALTNTGHELNLNMAKTSIVIDEISENFEEMKSVKSKQEKSAAEADSAVRNIQSSIDSLYRLVEEQATSVETSSTAIEEMIANIRSVTKTLMDNSKNVGELTNAAESGRYGLQAVTEKIKEIVRDSEGLLEVNAVMENIASQTNLLSMNAAIEAAHAGESGRGFAVVAGEIRKLAESSSNQSKTTATMLKKIKNSIDSITASSNDVLSRFEVIDTGVKTVSQHEKNILSSMEEQEVGGQQLLKSIELLKKLSVSVEKGSSEMMTTGGHLIKQTNDLINNSNDAINGMNEMLSGAMNQIQTAVNQVDEMSAENSRNFSELKQETDKFKISLSSDKKKILLVDDDNIYIEMASAILGDDYDVTTANSGKEALQLFYQGFVPNLVLLDLVMPDMDGWNTFDRIRGISRLHRTPIAICSGSDEPENIEQARKVGAADFIKKPCNDLIGRVKNLI